MRYLIIFQEYFVSVEEVSTGEVSTMDVGQALLEMHHQLHRIVDQRMSASGLSLARAKVLMRLTLGGPMNQATLAAQLGFAPRSVTETVDALEREGLVMRTEDESDRRARIVTITAAGQQACDTAQAVRVQAMDDIFGGLTPAERATLVGLLNDIRTNLPSGVCNVR
jgi:DNA-binding MarR family transcriptional regulator